MPPSHIPWFCHVFYRLYVIYSNHSFHFMVRIENWPQQIIYLLFSFRHPAYRWKASAPDCSRSRSHPFRSGKKLPFSHFIQYQKTSLLLEKRHKKSPTVKLKIYHRATYRNPSSNAIPVHFSVNNLMPAFFSRRFILPPRGILQIQSPRWSLTLAAVAKWTCEHVHLARCSRK